MDIFKIIIAPFIFVIEQLFHFSFNLSKNYGVSIILLSFFISLILLPVFILIEKAKRKDDAIKLKMKPFVEEIKRCYKGQERFYYLKTLNSQHDYSPIRALIPILSLLLQIPFFIAAYQFLEGFEPLSGIGFLFISDLSLPDALLGTINILPIAMTLVNILTAYFYTRNGNTSELRQMLIVAGIFLVLLFKLPSGLVLYWTMNNVFSFFRLFVTNPEVFKKKRKSEKVKKADSDIGVKYFQIGSSFKYRLMFVLVLGVYSQFRWAFQNNFDDIFIRILTVIIGSFIVVFVVGLLQIIYLRYRNLIFSIRIKPVYFFALQFSTLYFYLSGKLYFGGENISLLLIAAAILILVQFIGIIYVKKAIFEVKASISLIVLFTLIIILIIQIFNFLVAIGNFQLELNFLNINILVKEGYFSSFVLSGLLFSFITLPFYIKGNNLKFIKLEKANYGIVLLAILYLSGLIYIWNPIIVYSSYPEFFDFRVLELFQNNISVFLIVTLVFGVFYLIIPFKQKIYFLYTAIVVVAIFFINSNVFPLDLGTLQVSKFSSEENLSAPIYYYLLEASLLLGILYGVYWLIVKKHFKQIAIVLILLNVVQIGQAGVLVFRIKSTSEVSDIIVGDGEIHFSRNKENIVLILYDGFQGWFMDKIFKDDPSVKNTFDGFVWYPNTISISSLTYSSSAAIMCGYDYSVDKLNADNKKTLGEKVNIPCNLFIDKIKSKGYHLTSTKMWHSNIDKSQFDSFIPEWHSIWDQKLKHGEKWEIWFTRLWENALFNSVPLALKPNVYNNQQWLIKYDSDGVSSETHKYNFLKLLPGISKSNSNEPNFIYIHNMAPHSPWNILDEGNKIHHKVSPFENNKWCIYRIADWINWMKSNGVYNNTKIVLLSDHGPTWEEYKPGFTLESPLNIDPNNPDKIIVNRFWRLNALLMVKDFNSTGTAKEDWRLMSNADASAILFNEDDPTKNSPVKRKLPTSWAYWKKNILVDYEYNIYKYFEVQDNMFDLKNWKEIK